MAVPRRRALLPLVLCALCAVPGVLGQAIQKGITATLPLATDEAGTTTATFTLVLTTQPTADVVVGIYSDDPGEGVVDKPAVTFTAGNWNAPQAIVVTGQQDAKDDDDVAYNIRFEPATSADAGYNGFAVAPIACTNADDDVAALLVAPATVTTSEAGTTAEFEVVLATQPDGDVLISVTVGNPNEGAVDRASITFSSGVTLAGQNHWSSPATLTLTGVDDDVQDGAQPHTITLTAGSADAKYDGKTQAVQAVNTDNDSAGIAVVPAAGITTEAGGQATFSVSLVTQPADSVTLSVVSSLTTEGTVSEAQLVFTTTDWNVARVVVVTGAQDSLQDGPVDYTVTLAVSSTADPTYQAVADVALALQNVDDDTAGVLLTAAPPLVTTEAGGTATFQLVLQSMPTSEVTFTLSVDNAGEGDVVGTIVFTPARWNAPIPVVVTGKDDNKVDGDIPYTVIIAPATSADPLYAGQTPGNVAAVNTDNDIAGITMAYTGTSFVTTEAGGTASLTVVLDTQPASDVTLLVQATDETEVVLTNNVVVFTSANWSTPATVTGVGRDDMIDDGAVGYTIIAAVSATADPVYQNVLSRTLGGSTTDDDAASLVVAPTSGLATSENGGFATFTVTLGSEPTAEVVIVVSSDDTSEVAVDINTVRFTPANWMTPVVVTVTGVQDAVADGDMPFTITLSAPVSRDLSYNNIAGDQKVAGVNADDDVAGIVVTPTSGLTTTEARGTAQFAISLHTQPTADVTVSVASLDASEGTASPATVVFNAGAAAPGANHWSTPMYVTVTGVDDAVDDGDVVYTVETSVAATADAVYAALNPADVEVTNVNDDVAGITASAPSGVWHTVISEGGDSTTYLLALDTEPTADVILSLFVNDTTEGEVVSDALTFTPANWREPQAVTVKGVDDPEDDGDVTFVSHAAAASIGDARYDGLRSNDVIVINVDDDTAGVLVTPTDLQVVEGGAPAIFSVRLATQPTDDVTISVRSSDESEGRVNTGLGTTELVFTPLSYDVVQAVQVTPVDDALADGATAFTVILDAAVSVDPLYTGFDAPDVAVECLDNDSPGVALTPSATVTSEAGASVDIAVRLTAEPAQDVTVRFTSSDQTEGAASPPELVFTPQNYTASQTVVVRGQDDAVGDGDVRYRIITEPFVSGDPAYNGFDPEDLAMVNVDNDIPAVVVTHAATGAALGTSAAAPLTTSEGGGESMFHIRLATEPEHPVAVMIQSMDVSEGRVSVAQVIFDRGTWNSSAPVTVRGEQDAVDDGDVVFNVTLMLSTIDMRYRAMGPIMVAVVNQDDDVAGVDVAVVSPGDTTSEADPLQMVYVGVVLHTEPTAPVVVQVATSNPTEGRAVPDAITFLPSSSGGLGRTLWSTPQTVAVAGVDDAVDDGAVGYTLTFDLSASRDPLYAAATPPGVPLVNTDDDTAGLVVRAMPTASGAVPPPPPGTPLLTTSEADAEDVNATVTQPAGLVQYLEIRLASRPRSDVEVAVASLDATEGEVGPNLFTIAPDAWDVPQSVAVRGVDDIDLDGSVAYTVAVSSRSLDPAYANLNVDVPCVNEDDEVPGVDVVNATGLVTTEAGGFVDFYVRLTAKPSSNVVIPMTASVPTEGTVFPAALTYTPFTWNRLQSVKVTGVDDSVADGNVSYTVGYTGVITADVFYQDVPGAVVPVVNVDDDAVGVLVEPASLMTFERAAKAAAAAGGVDPAPEIITVRLASQPAADVAIPILANEREGRVVPKSLLFTTGNWSVPATVRVYPRDDDTVDGNVTYFIFTDIPQTADPDYARLSTHRITVVNVDDDAAGVAACVLPGCSSSAGGVVTERQKDDDLTITIALTARPTGDVVVPIASNDTSEGRVSESVLVFTSGTWDTARTVVVEGVQDSVDDGDVTFAVKIGPTTSIDPTFHRLVVPDILVTNLDDDTVGVRVTEVPTSLAEADTTRAFEVSLQTQPTEEVTIALSTSDPDVAVVSPRILVFTPDSAGGAAAPRRAAAALQDGSTDRPKREGSLHWNSPQRVQILPKDDAVDNANRSFAVRVGPVSSGDLRYNTSEVVVASNVTVADDDTAGFVVVPLANATAAGSGPATFTVALTSQPLAVVAVNMTSSDATNGGVPRPSDLLFSPSNWSTPVVVSVIPGPQASAAAYDIMLGTPQTDDPVYAGKRSTALPRITINGGVIAGGTTPVPGAVVTTPPPGAGTGCYNSQLVRPANAVGCTSPFEIPLGGVCEFRTLMGARCEVTVCSSNGWTTVAPVCPTTASPVVPINVCGAQYALACALKPAWALLTCGDACTAADCCATCASYACGAGSVLQPNALCKAPACNASECCAPAGTGGPPPRVVVHDDDDNLPVWAIVAIATGVFICLLLSIIFALLLRGGGKAEEEHDDKSPSAAETPPDKMVPDAGGQRYIARWSNTRSQYYYYPEGAGATAEAVWDLPHNGIVVTWRGGPDGLSSDAVDAPLRRDPYSVTPLPTAGGGGGDGPPSTSPPMRMSMYQYSQVSSPNRTNPLEEFHYGGGGGSGRYG